LFFAFFEEKKNFFFFKKYYLCLFRIFFFFFFNNILNSNNLKEIDKNLLEPIGEDDSDPFADVRRRRISEREDEYHARKQKVFSPQRVDAFTVDQTPDASMRTYADIMREKELERQEQAVLRKIEQKKKEEKLESDDDEGAKKKRRWDLETDEPSKVESTPTRKKNRWDETPVNTGAGETPSKRSRSRWDETPVASSNMMATPIMGATPVGQMGFATPTPSHLPVIFLFFFVLFFSIPFFSLKSMKYLKLLFFQKKI